MFHYFIISFLGFDEAAVNAAFTLGHFFLHFLNIFSFT